jgi:predicted dehydrogenase
MSDSPVVKVGVIGARRVRQGLGPYVVQHLTALGAEVPCFLASRPEGVPETERATGARGYTSLERMLAAHPLDALAILSPAESHERYLEAALEAGLHVLCEKPLVWGGAGLAERAAKLEHAYREAGLGLRECCQWPETLPAYRALHPDVGPVRSFRMRLSPASREPRVMLGDSLSHPLSLLQVLVPGAGEAVEVRFPRLAPGSLEVAFGWRTAEAAVAVRIELITREAPPREAGYGVNGHWAERRIRPRDYAFSFADGEREVPVPDPLRELLRGFVRAPARPPSGEIGVRMANLERILDALPAEER